MNNFKKTLLAMLTFVLAGIIGGWLFAALISPAGQSVAPPAAEEISEIFPTGSVRSGIAESPLVQSGLTPPPAPVFSRLTKLTVNPVAGAFILSQGTTTALIYLDRASGNLFTITPARRRLTNTTIPKIYEVYGGGDFGEIKIIARYLKEDLTQNFSATTTLPQGEAGDETTPTALNGQFLNPDIYAFAVSPDRERIFYLQKSGGETRGVIANFDGSRGSAVFSSPFNEWRARWPATNTVSLQTKPSAAVPGFLYWLNPITKEITRVIGDIPALSTLESPNLQKVFWSGTNEAGALISGLYIAKDGLFLPLPFKTLAEKCVWNQNGITLYCAVPAELTAGNYPDDWYRGEINFSDNFWQIDTNNFENKLLFNSRLARFQDEIDAVGLFLNPEETTLFFTNKNGHTLWAFNLREGF